MLVEFRVENYRSLRDEQALTLETGSESDEHDQRPREIPGHSKSLLPVAALYGPNASGKSNVIGALGYMRQAVLESHRLWSPDDGVPRDPFAWGPKNTEESHFEVTMIIEGVKFEYAFSASDQRFEEETLYAYPHNKPQKWFVRTGSDPIDFGENLRGENRFIESVTRPNSLFLSASVQNKHPQLMQIYSWFRSLRPVLMSSNSSPVSRGTVGSLSYLSNILEGNRSATLFDDPGDLVERFRLMLLNADVGVIDIKVVKPDPEEAGPKRIRPPRFFLKHQSSYEDSWLPLDEESAGTRTLFRIAVPILQTLDEGGVLLVDELESNLHPSLAQQIVKWFNDRKSNPKNAQLIFTTHDTNLLGNTVGEPALRRDQVWLTEKDDEGASVLYPLTDYKPRKTENLERGYLQGRYRAIPFLGNFIPSGG